MLPCHNWIETLAANHGRKRRTAMMRLPRRGLLPGTPHRLSCRASRQSMGIRAANGPARFNRPYSPTSSALTLPMAQPRSKGHSQSVTTPAVTKPLLSDVSTIYMCPQLQKIAVAALHDPDPAVVTDAAKALGAHGSPAAEAVLWGRLREWYQEWRGRETVLTGGKFRGNQERPEVGLAQALATSPAWLISRAQLRGDRTGCGDCARCAGAVSRSSPLMRATMSIL